MWGANSLGAIEQIGSHAERTFTALRVSTSAFVPARPRQQKQSANRPAPGGKEPPLFSEVETAIFPSLLAQRCHGDGHKAAGKPELLIARICCFALSWTPFQSPWFRQQKREN